MEVGRGREILALTMIYKQSSRDAQAMISLTT